MDRLQTGGAAERRSFASILVRLLAPKLRAALSRAAPAVWAALGAAAAYYPSTPGPRAFVCAALALGGAALPLRAFPFRAPVLARALLALSFGLVLGASARLGSAASGPPGELVLHRAVGLLGVACSDSKRTSSGNRSLAAGLEELLVKLPGAGLRLSWPRRKPRLTLILDARTDFHAGQRLQASGLSAIEPAKALYFAPKAKLAVRPSASWVDEARGAAREALSARIRIMSGTAFPLAQALLLGVTDEIDGVESALFRDAGCAHILSLSGQHLSILCLLATILCKKLLKRPKAAGAAALLLAFFFTWLAGPGPSLLRSCLSVLLSFCLTAMDRPQTGVASLATVFCLALALRPVDGTRLSFLLSYAAMLGLSVLGRRWENLLWRLPPPLAKTLAPSLAAILATAPIGLGVFGSVPTGGVVAASLSGPLVLALMWSLLASLPLSFVPFLVPTLCSWHEILHRALLGVLRSGAVLPKLAPSPGFALTIAPIGVVLVALFVYASPYVEAAAFAAGWTRRGNRSRREGHGHSLRLALSPQKLPRVPRTGHVQTARPELPRGSELSP